MGLLLESLACGAGILIFWHVMARMCAALRMHQRQALGDLDASEMLVGDGSRGRS